MRFLIRLLIVVSGGFACASQAADYNGYGAGSVTPELIKKFAPPALTPEVSAYVQRFMDLRAPGVGRVTDSGRQLFFSWSVTGVRQIWRLNGPNTFPMQMTGGEDNAAITAISPDGRYLALQRDQKGKESPGLYLQPVDGGAMQTVHVKNDVQTLGAFFSDDSRYLFYVANDIKPDSYAVYRYSLQKRERELIFSEDGHWSAEDFIGNISPGTKDGRLLLVLNKGNFSQEIWEYDLVTKKKTPIIGQGEDMPYEAVYASASRSGGSEFFVKTDKLAEFERVYRFKTGGKLVPVTPDVKADVESIMIDHERHRLAYAVNDGGYTKTYFLDAKTNKPITVTALSKFKDADHVVIADVGRSGRFMTVGVSYSDRPRTGYVYDWQKGVLTEWVLPSAPEINTKSFAKAELDYATARDGTKIPLFVRKPLQPCPTSCPVVVHFHGGPEGQSTPGFSLFAQMFVEKGFIFVEPNVRGSTGYGKTWRDSDNGVRRLNVITDIEDVAKYVRTRWAAGGKPAKIGVMGWSYGGYATLMAMSRFAGAFDAGVAMVGMSNLATFLKNTAPYRRLLRISEYGDPDKNPKELAELSPISHIDRVQSPLLITQGANDPRVPVGEAIQIYDALAKKNLDAHLIVFPDEGHGAAKRENSVIELGSAIEFFQKHL